MTAVTVRGVHKRFGRVEVLRGVDLDVEPGTVCCLLGPSGSGKSTFLRCINHLEKVTAGRLSVDGVLVGYRQQGDKLYELKERETARARAEIGMVFQRFNLFPHLSVGRNVMLAPSLVKKAAAAAGGEQAKRLLARVGLAEKFDASPDHLSGGQQQRVAIARALAMEPAVLLCDEITSALDPELVGEVLRVVESLAVDGMTLLMVTHEMSFARKVSDRVVFMHAGRIHEIGPPQQIFGAPQSAELRQFLSALDG